MYAHLARPGKLLVDVTAVPVVAHQGLISRSSEYFRSALSGEFREGKKGEVELDDESLAIFLLFIHWLYTGKLHAITPQERRWLSIMATLREPKTKNAGPTAGSGGEAAKEHDPEDVKSQIEESTTDLVLTPEADVAPGTKQDDLIALYILADRRGVRHLRNCILNRLIEEREKGSWQLLTSHRDRIATAYASLMPSSKLCRYLADEAAWYWDADLSNMDGLSDLPAEFLGKMMASVLQGSRNSGVNAMPPWREDICSYHEHVDGEDAAACKERRRTYQEQLRGKGDGGTVRAKITSR
jgi:hypothetical protein